MCVPVIITVVNESLCVCALLEVVNYMRNRQLNPWGKKSLASITLPGSSLDLQLQSFLFALVISLCLKPLRSRPPPHHPFLSFIDPWIASVSSFSCGLPLLPALIDSSFKLSFSLTYPGGEVELQSLPCCFSAPLLTLYLSQLFCFLLALWEDSMLFQSTTHIYSILGGGGVDGEVRPSC